MAKINNHDPADVRTLLVFKTNGDEFQIDIPSNWKVTFGPLALRNETAVNHNTKMPMALRLYESECAQRAVFTDVIGFRDMSIPVRIKQTKVQEKEGYMECEGVRKRTTFQATTFDWVNPDEPVNSKLLSPPSDETIFSE